MECCSYSGGSCVLLLVLLEMSKCCDILCCWFVELLLKHVADLVGWV